MVDGVPPRRNPHFPEGHFVKICTLTPFSPFSCQDLHPDPIFPIFRFNIEVGMNRGHGLHI